MNQGDRRRSFPCMELDALSKWRRQSRTVSKQLTLKEDSELSSVGSNDSPWRWASWKHVVDLWIHDTESLLIKGLEKNASRSWERNRMTGYFNFRDLFPLSLQSLSESDSKLSWVDRRRRRRKDLLSQCQTIPWVISTSHLKEDTQIVETLSCRDSDTDAPRSILWSP